jgi:hypothetical protein
MSDQPINITIDADRFRALHWCVELTLERIDQLKQKMSKRKASAEEFETALSHYEALRAIETQIERSLKPARRERAALRE